MTAAEKLLVALLEGAYIRARKSGPFASTRYMLVRRSYDEITSEYLNRDEYEVSENTVARLAKQGVLDTREAIKTFTENATEYVIRLTEHGIEEARSVKLSAAEVARAG